MIYPFSQKDVMQLIPRAPQSRWPKGVTCHQRPSKRKNFKIISLPPEPALGLRFTLLPSTSPSRVCSLNRLNSEHTLFICLWNRFLYPKDLTNFLDSINYHFYTICANGMQQYCRLSRVIMGLAWEGISVLQHERKSLTCRNSLHSAAGEPAHCRRKP